MAQRSAANSVGDGLRGLLVGAACGLARSLDRFVSASTFAAAGLLTFDGLRRHMNDDWQYFGNHQPEADVAGGLFPWEHEFYAPHLRRAGHLLVVGCGGGRDLLALLDLGYRADGLETVVELAQRARERLARRGLTATVHTADIVTAALPE